MSNDREHRTGGHVLVEALHRAGTSQVFAIHGVQIDPIFQACADIGVELVDVRHESSAGFAAEATARLTGNIGAAAVCPGPGFTNVLTSIANAKIDRTPVIYIVSSNPGFTQENNGLQVGLDHVAIAAPISKWACKVEAASELARMVAQAIRVATTAPRGPVVLDVPSDILAATSASKVEPSYPVRVSWSAPGPEEIDQCLGLLAAASRPALLIGHTASDAARRAAASFATRTQIPCFFDYRALGILPDSHVAYGGTLYQLAALPAHARPDIVMAVGVTFGFDTPGLRDGGRTWGTRIIHVDADASEVGRLGTADDVALVADPNQMLCALASSSVQFSISETWTAEVKQSLARARADLDAIAPVTDERIHPYWAARSVAEAVNRHDAVLVGDGAVCKHWLHDALRPNDGGRYLTHGRFGCMGSGSGLAIGAAYAIPRRPIVCVTGDGALGFSIGEFEAVVRHGLAITFVVMNNARWGASQGFQLRPGGRGRVVGTSLSDADYDEVMAAFGGVGLRVNTVEGLDDALEVALASRSATCINVSTNSLGVAPEIPLLNA